VARGLADRDMITRQERCRTAELLGPAVHQGVAVAVVDELTAEIRSATLRLIAEVCLREHGASRRLGLGGTDVRFLTLLDLHGPLTPGRLATLTGLTTGSVTGVIDRLERAGMVSRQRDDEDRRKVQVVVRPEATARLAAERHDNLDLLDRVLARRDAAQLEVIARFLGEIAAEYDDGSVRRGPLSAADPAGCGPG
jgi:DNA-binding MarR family transcriptional regulator